MKPWSKQPIGNRAAAFLCVATLAAGAGARSVRADAPAQVGANTTPLWQFTTTSDITFFELASSDPPRLVVATKDELHFVDATTGKALWSRADLRKVTAVHFDVMASGAAEPVRLRGIALADDVMQIFDLETGAKLSESGNWNVKNVSGYLPVYGHGLVLVLAKTAGSNRALLGVELQSGTVRWRREDIFSKQPEMHQYQIGTQGLGQPVYAATLFGNQPPLQLDSANLLLYLSEDGPFDINPATGKTVWNGAVLKKKVVPGIADGYAPILVEQGVAYVPVPSEHTLVALNASDGTPLWPSAAPLPGQIVQMEWTARGLLVAGGKPDGYGHFTWDPFLALLNPATGHFRWPARVKDLKDTTPFTVQGDTAYMAVNKKLVAIDLAKGSARDIATVTFEGQEQPNHVEVRPDGVLLISAHNLLLLGADGSPKYRRYYPAAKVKVGFLAAFGIAFLNKPISRPNTMEVRDFVYIFTSAPDPGGHSGLSLVRVNKADGAEAGRIWLAEPSFDYKTDSATNMVYLKQGSQKIAALRFDVGTSGPPQAPPQ
jgi:outer membrane protein assembly factor BamB